MNQHSHFFLGAGHAASERRTWIVIGLCAAMMGAEIIGGVLFGSIALVADGLHMSTHAAALLLAAVAYTYSRRHAEDPRFTFGTGKVGDLAGFASAIILAMIALLIGYESITRFLAPVPIRFAEALPIAVLGLLINIASAWLLSAGAHEHGHGHHHSHGAAHRDNNLRAAVIHVIADAAVSVLVIIGLLAARSFGWLWMDPLAGIVGAGVTASWALGLIRDTGAILLDMNPDGRMANNLRQTLENDGDQVADLHLWRLGPGHLGAIVCVDTRQARGPDYYRAKLASFRGLSHLTIEVHSLG
ncbi:MAG TPA: CDF family Co(II)/Ni(II) efflux transporter DmeF [Steroidobacteraceae bacterium]|nr:CDF family Co(II)/Ni(II) efflux transporter DmeF [Steroidobacteraceae bacterium]